MSLIEVKDVSYVHPSGVKALDGVTLSILKNEMVAIVGENGAGKTTLVRHMNGLLKPTTGTVLVDGKSTREVSTAMLSRKVGVAFQNPDHQLFSESVEKEMTFAMVNFGFEPSYIEERVGWALDYFDLGRYRKSSPLILSGGEKKRLTLASILAWDPEVVILDEPTVGQDAIQKEKLAEISRTLHDGGKTLVIVSHDVEFLWSLQPRIVVMKQGRIVGNGPCPEVMKDEALLDSARVTQPQLVKLYDRLSGKPDAPFLKASDAADWIARERS